MNPAIAQLIVGLVAGILLLGGTILLASRGRNRGFPRMLLWAPVLGGAVVAWGIIDQAAPLGIGIAVLAVAIGSALGLGWSSSFRDLTAAKERMFARVLQPRWVTAFALIWLTGIAFRVQGVLSRQVDAQSAYLLGGSLLAVSLALVPTLRWLERRIPEFSSSEAVALTPAMLGIVTVIASGIGWLYVPFGVVSAAWWVLNGRPQSA